MRSIVFACIVLGTAVALSGCGSKTETSGTNAVNAPQAAATQPNNPHVPQAAISGQAALSQQRQASAAGYAAMMKKQAAQAHKQ